VEDKKDIRPDILVCLSLALAVLCVYLQVSAHEFISYDDRLYVVENPHIASGLSQDGFRWAFSATQGGNWHPLVWLSHMLDCHLYGMNPGRHHLTNVILHIVNTILLFIVFRRMTGASWRSALVAAVFALHPLHVESVAWVSERKDVLSTFFWMLIMWSYVRYVARPSGSRYLWVLLLFALGLMSKPMLVTLPCVLLLLDYWPLGRFKNPTPATPRSFRSSTHRLGGASASPAFRLIWEKLPLLVLAVMVSVFTVQFQRSEGGLWTSLPLNVKIANALVSYGHYLVKMVWPSGLAVIYPHTGMPPAWQVAGAGLMLAATTAGVAWKTTRHPYLAFGWLWYLGTLVPVIGVVQVGFQGMADRYTYVPLIGIFVMIAWAGADLAAEVRSRRIAAAALATMVLLILSMMSWVQTGYWRNGIVLFRHALGVTSNNFVAHNQLGIDLYLKGRLDEAVDQYWEALSIYPDYFDAHYNLGMALEQQGKTDDAIEEYSKALSIDRDRADAHRRLGDVLAGEGRVGEALGHYLEVLRVDPNDAVVCAYAGFLFRAMGRTDEAIRFFRRAVRMAPELAQVHNVLGEVLVGEGRLEEAAWHFREALRIDPDFTDARDNLGKTAPMQEEGGRPGP
jgi:Tfp pilus assembly protein PilF